MNGLNLSNVREFIVVPSLDRVGMGGLAAVRMVCGTGLVESGGFTYLDQTTPGPGPAYGLWQMEKATHDDLWKNFIPHQPSALIDTLYGIANMHPHRRVINGGVASIMASGPLQTPPIETLHWNLMYGAIMCRLLYRRVRQSLPDPDDALAMAHYWKDHYNTVKGAGTIEKALPYFQQVVSS